MLFACVTSKKRPDLMVSNPPLPPLPRNVLCLTQKVPCRKGTIRWIQVRLHNWRSCELMYIFLWIRINILLPANPLYATAVHWTWGENISTQVKSSPISNLPDSLRQVLRLTFKSKWVVETDDDMRNLLYCEWEVIPGKLCDGNYASRWYSMIRHQEWHRH